MKSSLQNVKLKDLKLDMNNPRFAELYSGSDKEEELIEYLLYNESAEDVASAIVNAGEFYPDRPLWVLQDGAQFIVKDGNRRCAAVKALQFPTKYDLSLPKTEFSELPVLVYKNIGDLSTRILHEHTSSLFKEWDRIAKALEAYKLFTSGTSLDSMIEIDSHPIQLVKLASFYYQAVKVGGEDLKKLLRRGRGKTGGKTIIFERLFKHSDLCGYSFKAKPSYEVNIIDQTKFDSYIDALVKYLQTNPVTKTDDIDREKETFLLNLAPYGFSSKNPDITPTTTDTSALAITNNPTGTPNNVSDQTSPQVTPAATPTPTVVVPAGGKKKSIKDKPIYIRKKIPAPLESLIRECYSIDQNNFANAKTALARVTFECTLKYIVENTKYGNKKNISESNYFRNVFYDSKGQKKNYTDFTKLKNLFAELITNTGDRKAFESFDLDRMHQIIHNYKVGAIPADAKGLCDNLIALVEFMLNEEEELLNSINISKL